MTIIVNTIFILCFYKPRNRGYQAPDFNIFRVYWLGYSDRSKQKGTAEAMHFCYTKETLIQNGIPDQSHDFINIGHVGDQAYHFKTKLRPADYRTEFCLWSDHAKIRNTSRVAASFLEDITCYMPSSCFFFAWNSSSVMIPSSMRALYSLICSAGDFF